MTSRPSNVLFRDDEESDDSRPPSRDSRLASKPGKSLRFAATDDFARVESPIRSNDSSPTALEQFRFRSTQQALEKVKDAEFQHALDQELRFERQLGTQRQWANALADENHCMMNALACDGSIIESYAFQIEVLLRSAKDRQNELRDREKHHREELEVCVANFLITLSLTFGHSF